MSFNDVLDAVEKLPFEDQETLIALLERRRVARRRAALAKDAEEARREFQAGACRPQTQRALMEEILS